MSYSIYTMEAMDFNDFDKLVLSYCPLNKSKTRYLINFIDGSFKFYNFDKKKKVLSRAYWGFK